MHESMAYIPEAWQRPDEQKLAGLYSPDLTVGESRAGIIISS